MQNHNKPILIYFNTRGNAQVIRSVLLEIGVPFDEIFVPLNGHLDQQIISKYKMDLKNLPYFVHNDLIIHGVFPIIKYCCVKFGRLDLLGNSIQDSIRITEIMIKETKQQGQILHWWFQKLREIYHQNLGENGIYELNKTFMEKVEKNKSYEFVRKMFSQTKKYIFGYLTVLDFCYYEKSFYTMNTASGRFPEAAMIVAFGKYFETTDFYLKNSVKLNVYKIFLPEADEIVEKMLEKLWLGDRKYLDKN